MFSRAFVGAVISAALVRAGLGRGRAADRQRPHRRPANRPARSRRRPPSPRAGRSSGDGRGREQTAYQVVVSKDGAGRVGQRRGALPGLGQRALRRPRARVRHEVHVEGARLGRDEPAVRLQRARDASRPASSSRATGPRSGSARPPNDLNLSGDKWIWYTNDDAVNNMPALTRFLRATVTLPRARRPRRACSSRSTTRPPSTSTARRSSTPRPPRDNDENAWQKATQLDVTSLLHSGANTIAVQVKNRLNQNGDPHARRLHRPPEGRHHDLRHEQRLEDEHHRPRRLAAARLR